MTDINPLLIIIIIVLIIFSAFFSASETALTSLNKIKIRSMIDNNVKGAERVHKITEDMPRLLSSILIGNNIVNILASSIMTSVAILLFPNKGVAVATIIMTIVVLIFGEITPKTFAAKNPEKVAIRFSGPISGIMVILTPIVAILNAITSFVLKFAKSNDEEDHLITEDELKTMVNVGHEEGILEIDEREMINNVFDFGDTKAKDVMTPRTDMVAVDVDASYDEISRIFQEEGFLILPVYEENVDNIVGVIYLKDIAFASKESFDIIKHIHEPLYTYETKPVLDLLSEMKRETVKFAVVVDEYGGTSGIVTLTDLIEELVGDFADDEDDSDIQLIKDDEYIIDGTAKLDDVNEMIGTDIQSDTVETIAGYIISLVGRFPAEGEVITHDNIIFRILEVDKKRVLKIKLEIPR
ncbi:MAG: HlyC/CorC family transporter [Firmicutes bacterium]|nr:HlyC/CorC family transporter [Bacillota bacterium]MBR2594515.1 HlyC/CorC family transporter [Bacillota bacterium]